MNSRPTHAQLRHPATVLSALALVLALLAGGGEAVADGAISASKKITGKQVKDGSLGEKDLTKGVRAKLKNVGRPGPAGPQGPQGVPGLRGATGATPDLSTLPFLRDTRVVSGRIDALENTTFQQLLVIPGIGEMSIDCGDNGNDIDFRFENESGAAGHLMGNAVAEATAEGPSVVFAAGGALSGNNGSLQFIDPVALTDSPADEDATITGTLLFSDSAAPQDYNVTVTFGGIRSPGTDPQRDSCRAYATAVVGDPAS